MPIPAMLLSAIPWIASAIPSIIDALRSGNNPEEARAAAKPHYDAIVDRLVGGGMKRPDAEKEAEAQIAPEVQEAMKDHPMGGMLSTALSLGGFFAGHKLAGKLGAKGAAAQTGANPSAPNTPGQEKTTSGPAKPSLNTETKPTLQVEQGGESTVTTADGMAAKAKDTPTLATEQTYAARERNRMAKTKTTELDGQTTMEGVPLNLDQSLGETQARAGMTTMDIAGPFPEVDPLARTQHMPGFSASLADTQPMGHYLGQTQDTAPFLSPVQAQRAAQAEAMPRADAFAQADAEKQRQMDLMRQYRSMQDARGKDEMLSQIQSPFPN